MALPFFENAILSGMDSGSPNREYRDMLQAYVTEEWYNSAAITGTEDIPALYEQESIGSKDYHEVEAMIANLIDLTSKGKKSGADFIRVFFRNFKHEMIRGRYYQFNDNYWIVDDLSLYEGVAPLMTLRRCNNALKIVDSDGSIFSIPCVVSYDMMSPSVQVSKYVITPNNHAEVIVQANENTLRLFKLNTRYILGGRPFKLLSMQNTLLNSEIEKQPTIMYLELYLDEIQAGDNIVDGIARNDSEQVESFNNEIADGIYLSPEVSKIRQYESRRFGIVLKNGNNMVDISNSEANITLSSDKYARVVNVGDEFELYCNAPSSKPLTMNISVPNYNISKEFIINCVSMMGG